MERLQECKTPIAIDSIDRFELIRACPTDSPDVEHLVALEHRLLVEEHFISFDEVRTRVEQLQRDAAFQLTSG